MARVWDTESDWTLLLTCSIVVELVKFRVVQGPNVIVKSEKEKEFQQPSAGLSAFNKND
jgi:hypothetical protein